MAADQGKTCCGQLVAPPGVQQLNGADVWDIGLPLQQGTQLPAPGVQPGQLMRTCPPGTTTLVQPVVLQQPAPQFAAPGVQPAVQPAEVFLLHEPLAWPQRQPALVADPGGPANAHPQLEEPATPQHPAAFTDPVQLMPGLQELEQCGALSKGHDDEVHVLTAPPTLQLPPPWQQQQHPAMAPAPELTPQLSTEKSAHAWFVGVAAAAGDGTAIE